MVVGQGVGCLVLLMQIFVRLMLMQVFVVQLLLHVFNRVVGRW